MSKGKSRATRPLPELQDGSLSATSTASCGADLSSTPKGSGNRLPSLRPKRDLSLGEPPPPRTSKKTFAPTIPVRRKKVAAASTSAVPPSPDKGTSRERGRGRERRGRGRGRGRRDRDIVTSASVFSMGPAEKLMQKRESLGETFGSSTRSEKSEGSAKVRREKPDGRYQLHFSDEEEEEEEEERGGAGRPEGRPEHGGVIFRDSRLPPIQLPLDYSLHARHKTVTTKNKIIKQETEEEAGGVLAAGPVKLVKPVSEPGAQSQPDRMTAANLFTPSAGSKGQFLFFQLPDCLPLERDDVAMDTSVAPPIQLTAMPSTSTSSSSEKREDEVEKDLPSLRDLPEGHIGKIRVHESGKVKLVLGDITLDVIMGTPTGFLQELVSIRPTEEEEGGGGEGPRMTVLGQLAHRLISTPDFESLLTMSRRNRPSPAANGYQSTSSNHEQLR